MLVTYAVDALIQNPDGTITVVKEEVFSVGVLNARLTELGVRAAAVRADPDCTATIEDAWGDLYPRIVKQDSSPGVTFDPDAIPADRTLVLAAEWDARRPSRPPRLVMRVMMVRGPAPACVGEILNRVNPLERFTAGGRRVVDHAREEARELGHHNIKPEHILLGLLDEPQSRAARVLNSLTIEVKTFALGPCRPVRRRKRCPCRRAPQPRSHHTQCRSFNARRLRLPALAATKSPPSTSCSHSSASPTAPQHASCENTVLTWKPFVTRSSASLTENPLGRAHCQRELGRASRLPQPRISSTLRPVLTPFEIAAFGWRRERSVGDIRDFGPGTASGRHAPWTRSVTLLD